MFRKDLGLLKLIFVFKGRYLCLEPKVSLYRFLWSTIFQCSVSVFIEFWTYYKDNSKILRLIIL